VVRQVYGCAPACQPGPAPGDRRAWTIEVGYEALYWIPFLRRDGRRYGLRSEPRDCHFAGGSGAWYEASRARYVEIFDLIPPDEFARQTAARRESERPESRWRHQRSIETSSLARPSARCPRSTPLASGPDVQLLPAVLGMAIVRSWSFSFDTPTSGAPSHADHFFRGAGAGVAC
jgi:hypothetical protein